MDAAQVAALALELVAAAMDVKSPYHHQILPQSLRNNYRILFLVLVVVSALKTVKTKFVVSPELSSDRPNTNLDAFSQIRSNSYFKNAMLYNNIII